jgi:hypothetical protein
MKYELEKRGEFIRRPLLLATLIFIGLLLVPALYRYNYKAQTRGKSTCSEGWYITGYYVPREDELPGDGEEINVERVGNLTFSQEFLNETRTEGWGITRYGWALGYYSSSWHRSDRGPLDASGNLLAEGAIAIDRSLIPPGAEVQILHCRVRGQLKLFALLTLAPALWVNTSMCSQVWAALRSRRPFASRQTTTAYVLRAMQPATHHAMGFE